MNKNPEVGEEVRHSLPWHWMEGKMPPENMKPLNSGPRPEYRAGNVTLKRRSLNSDHIE